jgi:hypothetical protein
LHGAASGATCRGLRWASRAICSPTRTFWPPAGWSTYSFPVGRGNGKVAGLPALPVKFGTDGQRPGIRGQPPRVGEHNVKLLGEAGFTTAEIAGLAEAGVIATRTGEGG